MLDDVSSMRRIVRRSDSNMAVMTRINLLRAPSPRVSKYIVKPFNAHTLQEKDNNISTIVHLPIRLCHSVFFISRAIESAIE